ncbi:MAG: ABC transporter ATP-binding protein [Alphaproteobacteria bacterium]|nr:ABC transporter ATP-binding protein [Alphaproteobacteria bacterium]
MSVPGVRIEIEKLRRVHHLHGRQIVVLDGLTAAIEPGERVAVVGASGSGKSTLMHILGLLDRPTGGRVTLDGREVGSLGTSERARIRNRRIGFVFQSHNLLREQTALGNVMMPVRLSGTSPSVALQRAEILLRSVGLGHRLEHLPGALSGGEQQRVALARALVMGPGLVLADEPTGNLDPATAAGVFDLMLQLNEQLGSTLVVVTHSMDLASQFPRVLRLVDGRVQEAA